MPALSTPLGLHRLRRLFAQRRVSDLDRPRRAAVALVLSGEEHAPELLLLRRAERDGDPWSGHMALPGGHAEPGDADLAATARREAYEELGLELDRAELLGRLDDVVPLRSSEISVRPFVFWLDAPQPLVLSAEVAEALWAPLSLLSSGSARRAHEVTIAGSTMLVPAYLIEQRVVWGMTFRVLESLVRDLSAPDGALSRPAEEW
jgi:8-oxo-dGTP pyrophosphatase MutT (NUDIX family)